MSGPPACPVPLALRFTLRVHRPSTIPRRKGPAALLLMAMLGGCSLREGSSEQIVVPEVVRTNLFVAPGGSDANPGTQSEPFRTIARAAQVVTPGTTVYVAPGQYMGGFQTRVSGSAEARIIFVSSERWGARIVPPLGSSTTTGWDNRGSYVDIIGFDIDGFQYQSGTKWLNGIYNSGSYNGIRHNHVHHVSLDIPCEPAGGAGIRVDSYYKGRQAEVVGNNVHDIGPVDCPHHRGIYVGTQARIGSNVVYRVSGTGIQLWNDAHHVEITGNTVSSSGAGIVVGGGDFYYSQGPNDHSLVANNIVFDNVQGILEQGATGRNNRYLHNLVFQNGAADWRLAAGRQHAGTIAAEPGFLEYSRSGTPDFRLGARSPAIGRGIAIEAAEPDFDGKPRSQATGFDIGAYQHEEITDEGPDGPEAGALR